MREIANIDGHELRDGLLRLGGLISQDTHSRYQLFHLKFYDYLRSDSGETSAGVFDAHDIATWHRRIINWCVQGTNDLLEFWTHPVRESREQERRSYALEHLASHLYAAREWARLWALLDNMGYARAKLMADPSTRTLAHDLDLGCRAIKCTENTPERRMQTVSKLWKYSLMRAMLTSSVREYPEQLYTLLVVRGRYKNAIEIVEEFSDVIVQARALYRIAQALSYIEPHNRDVLPVLARARDTALQIPDSWQQADTLVVITRELAASKAWAEAISTAYRIGSPPRKVLALNSVLEAMACVGERQLFFEHSRAVKRLAAFCGIPWEGEQIYSKMQSFLSKPTVSPQVLKDIDYASESIRACKALISLCPELLLRRMSKEMEVAPSKPLRSIYTCLVREICKTRPEHAVLVNWDCLRTLSDDSLDEIVERSLLLSLGPLSSSASAILSRSLSLTPVITDGWARVEALMTFDEDLRDLEGTSSNERHDDVLSAAVRVARTVHPLSSRNELLHELASAYVRLGWKDEAGRLEVEAGGGPLVVSEAEDLQETFTELTSQGNVTEAVDLQRSDRYFEQLLDRRNWDEALEVIRELDFTSKEADELAQLSRRGYDYLSQDERKRSDKLNWKLKHHEHNRLRCATRTATIVRAMIANGRSMLALTLISRALAYAQEVRIASERIVAMDAVFVAAVDAGARDIACTCEVELLRVSHERTSYLDWVSTLGRLIDGMLRLGYEARARRVLDELTEQLSGANGEKYRCSVLRVIARSCWRLKEMSRCIDLIDQEWGAAGSAGDLLQLFPLASTIAAFDPVQRSGADQTDARNKAIATHCYLATTPSSPPFSASG